MNDFLFFTLESQALASLSSFKYPLINFTSMKILDIPGTDRKSLEQTLSMYNNQVLNKQIYPELIRSPTLEDIPESGGLLTTTSIDGIFKGIAYYSQFNPANEEEFAEKIKEILYNAPKILESWDLEAFRNYTYKKQIIYISEIESFEEGTGRRMINYFKRKYSVGAIFVIPTEKARDYYPKRRFSPQRIMLNDRTANIMTWFKARKSN